MTPLIPKSFFYLGPASTKVHLNICAVLILAFGYTDKHRVTSTDLCHVLYTGSTEKKTIMWPKFLTFYLAG